MWNEILSSDPLSLAGLAALLFIALDKAFIPLLRHFLGRDAKRRDLHAARIDAGRSAAYGNIWTLTGAFNLFGPARARLLPVLMAEMRDWYFAHGQFLTEASRDAYFDCMELLGALNQLGVTPRRPDDALLYLAPQATTDVIGAELHRLRRHFGHTIKKERPAAPVPARALIGELKRTLTADGQDAETETYAWLVAQAVFSRFRTAMSADIRSRARIWG